MDPIGLDLDLEPLDTLDAKADKLEADDEAAKDAANAFAKAVSDGKASAIIDTLRTLLDLVN